MLQADRVVCIGRRRGNRLKWWLHWKWEKKSRNCCADDWIFGGLLSSDVECCWMIKKRNNSWCQLERNTNRNGFYQSPILSDANNFLSRRKMKATDFFPRTLPAKCPGGRHFDSSWAAIFKTRCRWQPEPAVSIRFSTLVHLALQPTQFRARLMSSCGPLQDLSSTDTTFIPSQQCADGIRRRMSCGWLQVLHHPGFIISEHSTSFNLAI